MGENKENRIADNDHAVRITSGTEMLDDIYILQDYAIIVNNKILNVDVSCVIRRIVTYHYTILVERTKQREIKKL